MMFFNDNDNDDDYALAVDNNIYNTCRSSDQSIIKNIL